MKRLVASTWSGGFRVLWWLPASAGRMRGDSESRGGTELMTIIVTG